MRLQQTEALARVRTAAAAAAAAMTTATAAAEATATATAVRGTSSSAIRRGVKNRPSQRQQQQQRDAVDVAFFKVILRALDLYKRAHGNLRIPEGFLVPSRSPWPKVGSVAYIDLHKCVLRSSNTVRTPLAQCNCSQ